LPSGILHGISIELPPPPIFLFIVDNWPPMGGLRCRIPRRNFSELKALAVPLTETPNGL
jgi:hypothetical protein